jgi:protein-S-isoprenylcysteine O-methyltransferase Ste14
MILFLKNLLFTLLLPGTAAVYIPLLLAEDRVPEAGPVLPLALAFFVMGVFVYVRCVWDFAAFGRGTPAPFDPPRKLVVRGLYRYTRNPMYVGILALLAGWALLFQTPQLTVYAFCLAIGFQLLIIFYEEHSLGRQFGAEYHIYCSRVGRWLPRIRC